MTDIPLRRDLRAALVLFGALTLITGLLYPLVITGVAQAAFPGRANGSLVRDGDRITGSALIGQAFRGAQWFHGRPSATAGAPYNAMASAGSNLGPTSADLAALLRERAAAIRAANPGTTLIPVDLLTASGSGLDPDISPAAALLQVVRVARARGLDPLVVRDLVVRHVTPRQFGLLGEPRVTVLLLNRALDSLATHGAR